MYRTLKQEATALLYISFSLVANLKHKIRERGVGGGGERGGERGILLLSGMYC